MDRPNVGRIEAPIKMSQVFEKDGIHFTESSGKVYVNALLYNADSFFTAEIINLEEEIERSNTQKEDETAGKPEHLSKRISVVELDIANLKNDLIRRRIDDSLVTARIREELDFFSNARKEDRIVISGLTSRIPMPSGLEERKKWLKDLVGAVLDQVEENSSSHVVNVMQGWKGPNSVPVAEVKMNSSDLALKLRKQFASKKGEAMISGECTWPTASHLQRG